MGWISNGEVMAKLRQVLNEVYELNAKESARSVEVMKQLSALESKVDRLCRKMDEMEKLTAMLELLGKKVNEIGKNVEEHYESFVKVSESDTVLFKLIAEGITGKKRKEVQRTKYKVQRRLRRPPAEPRGTVAKERRKRKRRQRRRRRGM